MRSNLVRAPSTLHSSPPRMGSVSVELLMGLVFLCSSTQGQRSPFCDLTPGNKSPPSDLFPWSHGHR